MFWILELLKSIISVFHKCTHKLVWVLFSAVVFTKTSSGTYVIIGTTCVESKHVMKSTTKKKTFNSLVYFQSLMLGSSYLQLGRVQNACAEFLRTRLSPLNVLGIRSFADHLGCNSLVLACNKYIKKYFSDVSESEEFVNLPVSEVCLIFFQSFLILNWDQL